MKRDVVLDSHSVLLRISYSMLLLFSHSNLAVDKAVDYFHTDRPVQQRGVSYNSGVT